MTYLALARKWRPKDFATLVGQDHVVRALSNALDTQRLHHAWLFTGTRGVGKTTLSRILAKSLNCEQGISSHPCGHCQACTEIDQGCFVDYLEFDAASNRGVAEMTTILENAIYAPNVGRFKVYMIDEVHMLTGQAFNAMLKTLEEPPEHVKFILATTDPQKIPVTVLSRCLQFNLKQMPPETILPYLQQVLEQEQIAAQPQALRLIAKAAAGSMRDALSLTDQAIAYGGQSITLDAVREMFGVVDQSYLVDLLISLLEQSAANLMQVAQDLQLRGLSFQQVLSDLAVMLQTIAVEQRLAGSMSSDEPLHAYLLQIAQALPADAVQLLYSIAIHARQELALAPDEFSGFVMAMLRMLSVLESASIPVQQIPRPKHEQTSVSTPQESERTTVCDTSSESAIGSMPTAQTPFSESDVQVHLPPPETIVEPLQPSVITAVSPPVVTEEDVAVPDFEPDEAEGDSDSDLIANEPIPEGSIMAPEWSQQEALSANLIDVPDTEVMHPLKQLDLRQMTATQWVSVCQDLPRHDMVAAFLAHCQFVACDGQCVYLRTKASILNDMMMQHKVSTVLSEYFNRVLQVHFEIGDTQGQSSYEQQQAQQQQALVQLRQQAQQDRFVLALQEKFGATINPQSIRPC